MNITLYVSSRECDNVTEQYIVDFLDVVSQVYKTHNKVDCRGNLVKETGFCIKVFKVENSVFKEKVWEPLKKRLGLQCAYIKKKGEYTGCILNWPDVFRPSLCSNV